MAGIDPSLLIAGDFVLLRMAVVDDLDGDYEAAIVLQRIAWRCERHPEGWPATHAEVQQETRLSERKVKRALTVLRERGYITGERASSWDPTQVWRVVLDRPSPDGRNVRHDTAGTSGTVADGTSVTSSHHVETKSETKDTAAGAAVRLDEAAAQTDEFGEFWRLYPRKTGKGAARAAYWKAVGKVGSLRLLAAVQAFAQHHAAARTATRYVPHPATWLNQERWDDVLPDVSAREAAEAADAERIAADRTGFTDHWRNGGVF